MKAAIYRSYGPPEVVSLAEIPLPRPGDHEVLIRVHATTVNRTDTGFRSAEYVISRLFSGLLRPKNPVLGNEFAGVVEACGKAVTLYQAGDRVFGYDDLGFACHAQYKLMPETGAMAHMPDTLDFAKAAPICEGAHYALCDIRAAGVEKGQEVLVYGATGAIGSAAVQICKHLGARVTAVCSTPHVGLIASLGADRVIDYLREDYAQSGESYDFVFDAVGKTSFGHAKRVLKARGIYISTELGKGWQNVFLALLSPLMRGKRVLFPLPGISREDVLFLLSLVEKGEFKPIIDRQYPLDQIVEAHRYVESGQKTGNVVIRVD